VPLRLRLPRPRPLREPPRPR